VLDYRKPTFETSGFKITRVSVCMWFTSILWRENSFAKHLYLCDDDI